MRFFKTLREKEFVIKQLRRWRIVPLIKYTLYRLHLSHYFFIHREHYRMRVWYIPLAFWLWTHETRAKEDEKFFELFLREGDTVIDCGAHLGTLTITASRAVGMTGKVLAYEMHPRTFSYLKRNIEDNRLGNVSVVNCAIGEEKKMVSITDEYVSDMNHVTQPGHLTMNVQMKTLDEVAGLLPQVTLLKLDVEGHELQALVGAEELLTRTTAVYFESAETSFARYQYSLKHVISFLKKRGFACHLIDAQFKLIPLGDTYITKVKYENILAIRRVEDYTQRVLV